MLNNTKEKYYNDDQLINSMNNGENEFCVGVCVLNGGYKISFGNFVNEYLEINYCEDLENVIESIYNFYMSIDSFLDNLNILNKNRHIMSTIYKNYSSIDSFLDDIDYLQQLYNKYVKINKKFDDYDIDFQEDTDYNNDMDYNCESLEDVDCDC